jgi:hypothetical protein
MSALVEPRRDFRYGSLPPFIANSACWRLRSSCRQLASLSSVAANCLQKHSWQWPVLDLVCAFWPWPQRQIASGVNFWHGQSRQGPFGVAFESQCRRLRQPHVQLKTSCRKFICASGWSERRRSSAAPVPAACGRGSERTKRRLRSCSASGRSPCRPTPRCGASLRRGPERPS